MINTPPSAWGASFWRTLDDCERKHYFTYVLGLSPAGSEAPALECGSVFHHQREVKQQQLSGASSKALHQVSWKGFLETQAGLTPAQIDTLIKKTGTTRPKLPPDWRQFPTETGVWLDEEYDTYWNSDQPKADGVDPLLLDFTVMTVENTVTVEDEETLRRLGLILPISAKYDTVVRLNQRFDKALASLEHKTVGKAMQFQKYLRDIQVDMQLVCWNATHKASEPPMHAVIIDEANKAQKPGKRFRREAFTRTPQETARFLANMRVRQERYITTVEASRRLEEAGASEQEVMVPWQEKEDSCFKYGQCKFLPLCRFGKDALSMFNAKGPENYTEPEEKEAE